MRNSISKQLGLWLPLLPLLMLWGWHLMVSSDARPDVLYADDWAVFRIPGYSRTFRLENVFGTQNDTIAAYQNLVQYLALRLFDLKFTTYIALQNCFLLAFLLAAWRVLLKASGKATWWMSGLIVLLLLPSLTGTVHFSAQAMSFVHQMAIVYLTLALLCLSSDRLGKARQPLVGLFLFLSAVSYLSGVMYLLAVTGTLLALIILRAERTALPRITTIGACWLLLAAVAAASIMFSDRAFQLVEAGTNHKDNPLLLPNNARFWTYYLITIARGVGLKAEPLYGAVAMVLLLAPLPLLGLREWPLPAANARSLFCLATPVLGALAALAMITSGRALLAGTVMPSVINYAATHPYYYLHVTFALPFAAIAWVWLLSGYRLAPVGAVAVTAITLAGFVFGLEQPLAGRFDYPAIYQRDTANLRDGRICLENKVRLVHDTDERVPVFCRMLFPRDLRVLIERAEAARVSAILSVEPSPFPVGETLEKQNAPNTTETVGIIGQDERHEGYRQLHGIMNPAPAGNDMVWLIATRGSEIIASARQGGVGLTQPNGFELLFTDEGDADEDVTVWAIWLNSTGGLDRIGYIEPFSEPALEP
ncbi:MAG: hypothetical protein CBB62_13820 [Micavibrio sp. TMED2]|nr:hypothetical protein [Alphaproteobacteria bacterium]MAS48830.1 hypothetical protein [Alphaproteobacteria bacterium]MAX94305.1 hypothetical protein [Alphaproteobacteria bacterium]OUT39450.1 MAG: hypothetical protein CBB62_13820 [Micavibrio sp. TMED2]